MKNDTYKPKYPVQTLEKAVEILNYFKHNNSSAGISISEISEQLNIGKSNVHRILDTLYAYNYIEKTANGSAYRLGWELFELGNKVPEQHSFNHEEYIPMLRALCEETSETVNLAILSQTTVIIIYKIEANMRLRSNVRIGAQEPLHCTGLGKLFLSRFSDHDIYTFFHKNKIERFTDRTISTPGQMISEIHTIREQGYAVDREEYADGLICIGVPIIDFSGEYVAAISVSGPAQRMSGENFDKNLKALQSVAGRISAFLGYKAPN